MIISRVPAGCGSALDVGCGLGALSRRLRTIVPAVTGIDKDQRSIQIAAAHPDAGDIEYLHADFMTWPLVPASFDLITAMASLHHMDAAVALERMRELLRPGGVLAIVGLARGSTPADVALSVPAALISARLHRNAGSRRTTANGYAAPICWPPPVSYRQMRQVLRGTRYRCHLYWRYSLTWC